MGLYWEVYGAGAGVMPVSLSLTMVKEGRSWLRRAASSLGIAGKEKPAVTLSWTAPSSADGSPMNQAIAVDLGPNEPGRYTLRIEASGQGRGTASVTREIHIER